MKNRDKLIFALIAWGTLFLIILSGCKTAQVPVKEVPVQYKERVVERLVPVELPQDSSSVLALFECDSLNNVIMKELNEVKTKRIQTAYTYRDGALSYRLNAIPGIINVRATDSIVLKEVPIKVPVPYEVNKLTWLQRIQIRGGQLFFILIITGIVYLGLKGKLTIFTKPLGFIFKILRWGR